jgi:glyoxylase-like metal-dependent hydrolase (beta-lactamase superfamily II)
MPSHQSHRAAERIRLGLAALLCLAAAVHAEETAAPEVSSAQIGPNSHVVQAVVQAGSAPERELAPNAGFVVTANAVVVIDALGSPARAAQLLAEIRRVTPKPVSHVLVTRFHADQAGGLHALKSAGAAVVARRSGQTTGGAEPETGPSPTPPDLALDGSTDLLIGGVHVQALSPWPSGTEQEMAYFFPEEGVLFAGDRVAPGRLPEVDQADTRGWIAALDEMSALDARVLVPGRGPPSTQAAADLQATRDYLLFLRETMGEAWRRAEPFDEAYERVDWHRFSELAGFGAFNRANASNTYLHMQQERD